VRQHRVVSSKVTFRVTTLYPRDCSQNQTAVCDTLIILVRLLSVF
jgi:hypothetical protein